MTSYTGTWVQKDGSGNGVTPKGARLAQGGLIAHDGASPLSARVGVLYDGGGAVVTGTATTGTMTYSIRAAVVAAFLGAVSSGGVVLGANDGAITVTTTAAPGSGSRTDRIWVRQHALTPDGSDTDTILEFGCASGAAIPTGAMELATALMTAGTTHTNTLAITQTHLWTVAAGAPIPVRNLTERNALTPFDGMHVYRLDTHVTERYNGTAWITPSAVRYDGVASAVTVGTSTVLVTNWSTQTYNIGDISYSAGVFTIVTAGIYRWDATVLWPGSVSTSYRVQQYAVINGTPSSAGSETMNFAAGYGVQTISSGFDVQLNAGDTFQLGLIGSTGGIAGVSAVAVALRRVL